MTLANFEFPVAVVKWIRQGDVPAVCGICAIWVLLIFLVNPVGEFPLNDDWAYALPVKELIEHGHLRFTDWQGMSLISQVVYGAICCRLFGFGFTILRLSTLLFGLAGIIWFYVVLRRVRVNPLVSFLLSLVLLGNPIYFELSYTFMTDVPFTAMAYLSLLLSYEAVRTENSRYLLLGTLCALFATLDRQVGIVLLIGPATAFLMRYGLGKKWLIQGLLPFASVVLGLIVYDRSLSWTIGIPKPYASSGSCLVYGLDDLAHLRVSGIISCIRTSTLYIGLFMLPFLLLVAKPIARAIPRSSRRVGVAGATLFAVSQLAVCVATANFPPWNNILADFGLGPMREVLHGYTEPNAPRWVWYTITAIASIGSGFTFSVLLLACRRSFPWPRWGVENARRLVFWVFAVPGIVYISIVGVQQNGFFDRYLLFLLLPLMVLGLQAVPPRAYNRISARSIVLAMVVLAVLVFFSTAGTHDYLEWNRARWQAVRWLRQDGGVAPSDFDGGFEVNSYLDGEQNICKQNVWPVFDRINPEYIISIRPLYGFRVVRVFSCSSWLPFGISEVIVLKRAGMPFLEQRKG